MLVVPDRAEVDLDDATPRASVTSLDADEPLAVPTNEVERCMLGRRKEKRVSLLYQVGKHLRDAEVSLVLRVMCPMESI